MDITKSQSDFEVACRNGLINYGLAKFENGEYASESTRAVFSGWLAGRESIEVELPAKVTAKDTNWTTPNKMREALALSLRTAGIRIKGESE
ncbi:hypothetical protein CH54_3794 [Yersinia rochesterensis]|uniref:Phage protein n=2 Tax=Yersiniaceae TaxID=1903411 RepID=A0ABM5SNV5_9GAMM|nr:hypothetical protein AW19_1991 [Yersinia frederiksenii Y225]AJJ36263.1 hypothetical protein CH54_3794 [Yersinia rochesterensis]ELZ0587179.1 hypothetical protein [Yersinia enterocolitica]HDL7937203.1 hypothetical protein [Yersinia enterocolitica]HEN3579111.1 hypothetical protein [Yersinia enterocolitica]